MNWEVLPPVTAPGDFAQVEAPQLVKVDGRYALLVSCQAEDHSQQRIERLGAPGETGTFVFAAGEMLGPYASPGAPIAAPDGPLGTLYAGKLVEPEPQAWSFMAFRGNGDRDFIGELTDPLPVAIEPDGQLLIEFARIRAGAER